MPILKESSEFFSEFEPETGKMFENVKTLFIFMAEIGKSSLKLGNQA